MKDNQRRWMGTRLVSAAACAMLMLAGCSGTPNPEGSGQGAGATVNVSLAAGAWTNTVKDLLPDFEQKTGLKVNLNVLGLEQLDSQYQVKLNAQSPDLDVMVYRPLQSNKLFAENGWLDDISENVKGDAAWDWNDFTESSRAATTSDEKVYGIPLMTEREILFYNKEMFAAKGVKVPATLDELDDAAKKLTDTSAGTYGVVMRGKANAAVTTFSSFLYSFGGDWKDADGTSGLDGTSAVDAYKYYGNLVKNYGPPGATSLGGAEAMGIFQQGKAAMYIDPDSGAGLLEDKSQSTVAGKVGYAPFPAGPAGSHPYDVTSWAAGISKFSKNKEAAWKFIEWATSKEVLNSAMAKQKSPSPRLTSWADPAVTKGFSPELVDIFNSYSKTSVGYDRPQVIQVNKARDIVGAPITAAINGEDVAGAAAKANDSFNEFLETDK